jgi:hypothetical protein
VLPRLGLLARSTAVTAVVSIRAWVSWQHGQPGQSQGSPCEHEHAGQQSSPQQATSLAIRFTSSSVGSQHAHAPMCPHPGSGALSSRRYRDSSSRSSECNSHCLRELADSHPGVHGRHATPSSLLEGQARLGGWLPAPAHAEVELTMAARTAGTHHVGWPVSSGGPRGAAMARLISAPPARSGALGGRVAAP